MNAFVNFVFCLNHFYLLYYGCIIIIKFNVLFFHQDKLQEVADLLTLSPSQISLIAKGGHERNIAQPPGFQGFISNKDFTPDSLIAGALESAFYEMVSVSAFVCKFVFGLVLVTFLLLLFSLCLFFSLSFSLVLILI